MPDKEDAKPYTIDGKKLARIICKNDKLYHQNTLMNTPGLTFFGIEWLNAEAENYVCNNCGYVHWFLNE